MNDPSVPVPIVRVRAGRRIEASDLTAAEVPLEIRVSGLPFAVVMRTPGADRALVAGFLLAERLVRDVDDLATLEHCTDPLPGAATQGDNIVNVRLDDEAAERAAHLLSGRREVMANAACGVCGRVTLESMREGLTSLEPSGVVTTSSFVATLPARLRERQFQFDITGGLHAAGVFASDGSLAAVAEDVGRHNAVDKVVGTLLLRGALPASACVLCVSGRTSYEIVQKAWCAGIPIVASVSAPSSLAVSLAAEAGITLVGFVRAGGLNIYTHASRIE